MLSRSVKENVCRMPGKEEKFSVFKLQPNFSINLRLVTHCESNVLTASVTITTIHFALRVVSAEFQTSRSEARHQRTMCKTTLLDSYRYNRPSSANICFTITSIERIKISNNKAMKNIVN